MTALVVLWAVFMLGPGSALPIHSSPHAWATEEMCEAEIAWLLNTKAVVINDPEYHLECIAVPDLRGEPA